MRAIDSAPDDVGRDDAGRRDPKGLQGRRAGLISRTGAAIVDVVIVALVVSGIYLAVVALVFAISPGTFKPSALPSWVLIPLTGVVALVYLIQGWSGTGRTYGCSLMGLRVVDRAGNKPGLRRSSLRAAAYVVFPAGLLWVAFSAANRSVQDVLVGTDVVYDWAPHEPTLIR